MPVLNRETYDAETQTIEATLRGDTRIVPCSYYRYEDGREDYVARGFTGRYRTGSKAWPATLYNRSAPGKAPYEFPVFGRDDRASNFQKMSALHFAENESA